KLTSLAVALAAAATMAASAAAFSAAPRASDPLTGVWTGILKQDLANLKDPYETKIVVRANKGGLTGIVAPIRVEWPEDAVRDARVVEGWLIGKGPALTKAGSFVF